MGMDVYGKAPRNEVGEYFRNNVWFWHPLWDFVCNVDEATEKERSAGHTNDGFGFNDLRSQRLAKRLRALDVEGKLDEHERATKAAMDALPDQRCNICDGTGTRRDMVVADGCNKCTGQGKVRPFETWYKFTAENARDFIAFLEACGGLEIL